jgi:hypothetical protein
MLTVERADDGQFVVEIGIGGHDKIFTPSAGQRKGGEGIFQWGD